MNSPVIEKSYLLELLDDFKNEVHSKIRQRGNEVFQRNKNNPFEISEDELELEMTISSTDGITQYEVHLTLDPDNEYIYGDCDCPYAAPDQICKHQIAAALVWKETLKNQPVKNVVTKKKASKPTKVNALTSPKFININSSSLERWQIQSYMGYRYFNWNSGGYGNVTEVIEEKKIFKEYIDASGSFTASIQHVADEQLRFSCNCGTLKKNHFCDHLVDLVEKVLRKQGEYYFLRYDDHSNEIKNELRKYGLTPVDEVANQFKFGVDRWGHFTILSQPENLLPISSPQNLEHIAKQLGLKKELPPLNISMKNLPEGWLETGLLFYLEGKWNLPFWIDGLFFVKRKTTGRGMEKLILRAPEDLHAFTDLGSDVIEEMEKITEQQMLSHLTQNGQDYLQNYGTPLNQINEEGKKISALRFHEVIGNMLPFLSSYEHLYAHYGEQKVSMNNVKKVSFSPHIPSFTFVLEQNQNVLTLQCRVTIAEEENYLNEYTVFQPGLLIKNHVLHLVKKEDLNVILAFKKGSIMIHEQEKMTFFEKILKPLTEKYKVDFGDLIKFENIEGTPQGKIYLSELNETFLLIKPTWQYGQIEVQADGKKESVIEKDKTIFKVKRKPEEETPLLDLIRGTHDAFKLQRNEFFYLPFTTAMKNNWFINFYHQMQQAGISVFGMNELKKFRYNTNFPKMNISASSGTDWFDVKMEVTYGEQTVPLAALRKAIMLNQEFILLGDGSFGMLPQEWITRYSMMMKMGDVKGDTVKLSKFHWTLIDELHAELNDDDLLAEIEEKKNRLRNIDKHQEAQLPSAINATLRDYQLSGFQWLSMLDHLGWGGILADDMGLGKTLQTLSFLQHIKEKSSGETHLIICPTSLIYNWENEIQKFTPQLSFHIHYGSDRKFKHEEFKNFDLIITSYGAVRNDIEEFTKFRFGYVVLDESQQIKNPAAQITKAIQLLSSRNKIALSGTPVQNNTFDLFSQMNTLNRGIFGSMEFFKSEFATPIDKFGDKQKTEQLRKLIYPFLLRRTKDQVAKDLPAKTETILWCEMEKEQRKIYDSFKDYYRTTIMERIAKDGLNRSGIYVLEGLLKLRQICDSPAILNEKEKFPNESVKLDELIRELEENTGTHKALVFSQFVSMLSLIENKLKQQGITYQYLDGSTTALNRQKAVKEFQEDADIRIFLISLKAGGLGLNLTAADYVYLIDPWWNPAVEQQAIDRTHRIGQTNKIFAYKMICKNTVEEKIITLQQKKKALASDLISDETGFVKKLTKEDVEYLFS